MDCRRNRTRLAVCRTMTRATKWWAPHSTQLSTRICPAPPITRKTTLNPWCTLWGTYWRGLCPGRIVNRTMPDSTRWWNWRWRSRPTICSLTCPLSSRRSLTTSRPRLPKPTATTVTLKLCLSQWRTTISSKLITSSTGFWIRNRRKRRLQLVKYLIQKYPIRTW